MKKTATLIITLFLSCLANPASAKEIKLYTEDNTPSAEEMANLLLEIEAPSRSLTHKTQTRSLSFGLPKKNEPINISLPIKFSYDSSTLNTESLKYLKQLGKMLNLKKMAQESIMIVGHTDITGSDNYNLNLSEKRSQAVKSFLVTHYQIDPARIETTGRGEMDTLPGKSGHASINRRVEFYRIQ